MEIFLVDGTYELFRHFYAMPSARDADGREVAAVKGVVTSMLGLINSGARYLAVATDHVIESFRNDMWPGYKTGAGIDPALFSQFGLLEEALAALGVAVWPMIEFEADDALAAAAATAAADSRVDRVVICTPDKDLGQCVRGTRVVQLNRRTRVILDEAGIIAKFGVAPGSIPDYLALVGDSSDGYPGLRGLGSEIGVSGAGALPAPGSHSGRSARVGREREQRRRAGADARPRARSRVPLPRPRDAAHGHPAVHLGRRPRVDRPDRRLSASRGASRRRCPIRGCQTFPELGARGLGARARGDSVRLQPDVTPARGTCRATPKFRG